MIKKRPSLVLLVWLIVGLLIPWTGGEAMEPPAGFRLVENRPGVALYRKDYQNGSPDYVQVVDLSVGASVDLLYGKPQGNGGKKSRGIFDGANPAFGYRTIHGYWQTYAQAQPEAFCVTNGQFFFMPENPAPLALPLKVDGTVVAEGFGYPQYPEKQLMLALWPDRADILPLTHDNLYGTTAPDAIGGLTEEANKKPKNAVGRTFVGIADSNGDGSFESVAILTTGTATQKEAARTLYSFGASKVMMLDGGGSTQLVCGGKAYIDTERALPQAIGVAAAGEQGSSGAGEQGGGGAGVMPTPAAAVVAGALPAAPVPEEQAASSSNGGVVELASAPPAPAEASPAAPGPNGAAVEPTAAPPAPAEVAADQGGTNNPSGENIRSDQPVSNTSPVETGGGVQGSGDSEVGGGRAVVGRAFALAEQNSASVGEQATDGGQTQSAQLRSGAGMPGQQVAGLSGAARTQEGVNLGDLVWLPAVISPVSFFLLMGVRRKIRN